MVVKQPQGHLRKQNNFKTFGKHFAVFKLNWQCQFEVAVWDLTVQVSVNFRVCVCVCVCIYFLGIQEINLY